MKSLSVCRVTFKFEGPVKSNTVEQFSVLQANTTFRDPDCHPVFLQKSALHPRTRERLPLDFELTLLHQEDMEKPNRVVGHLSKVFSAVPLLFSAVCIPIIL